MSHVYNDSESLSIDPKSGRRKLSGLKKYGVIKFVCFWRDSPQWARAFSFTRYYKSHTTTRSVGKTPLAE